jgi:hypothetical protein
VPTTRALCCIGTGDQVLRDMFYNGDAKMEPGAVVCRVSPSFVRFGTFQLPVSRGGLQTDLVKLLADYGEWVEGLRGRVERGLGGWESDVVVGSGSACCWAYVAVHLRPLGRQFATLHIAQISECAAFD